MNRSLRNWIAGGLTVVGVFIAIAGWIPTTKTGSAPDVRNWVITQLDAEHPVTQTFTSERPGLIGLRVLLFARPLDRDDPITLRLRYADDGATPDLAIVTVPLRELNPQGWTTFRFPSFGSLATPGADATTLLLILEAPTIPRGEGINVIAGPDTYPGGRLFIADEELGFADLAFEPVYAVSLLDRIMPVSQLATDKPGLFGQPGFYGLLCGAYLLSLVGAVLALTHKPDKRPSPAVELPHLTE